MSDMTGTDEPAGERQTCGCCGRRLPLSRLAELGTTPGVYVCAGCALWAARRAVGPADLGDAGRAVVAGATRLWRGRRQ